MIKRILVLALMLIMCVSLSACRGVGGGTTQNSKDYLDRIKNEEGTTEWFDDEDKAAEIDDEEEDKHEYSAEKAVSEKEKNTVKLKDAVLSVSGAEIKIKGYSIIPSATYTGKDEIHLFIEFTNKLSRDSSFYSGTMTVYQDGITLDYAYAENNEGDTRLQTNISIDTEEGRLLRNSKSDIQIKFEYPNENYTREEAEYTIKIK